MTELNDLVQRLRDTNDLCKHEAATTIGALRERLAELEKRNMDLRAWKADGPIDNMAVVHTSFLMMYDALRQRVKELDVELTEIKMQRPYVLVETVHVKDIEWHPV